MMDKKERAFKSARGWTIASFVIIIFNIIVTFISGANMLFANSLLVSLFDKVWVVIMFIVALIIAYFLMHNINKTDDLEQPTKIPYYIIFAQTMIGLVMVVQQANTLQALMSQSNSMTPLEQIQVNSVLSSIYLGIVFAFIILAVHITTFIKTLRLEKYRELENE